MRPDRRCAVLVDVKGQEIEVESASDFEGHLSLRKGQQFEIVTDQLDIQVPSENILVVRNDSFVEQTEKSEKVILKS